MSTHPRVTPPEPREGGEADPFERSVLAHQPELLRAFLRLYGTLWSHGVVDHATKEVARLRNARVTDCRYCRNVRFSRAREEGLTEDVVALIDEGFEESALSERHKAVIRYADVFLTDPGGLSEDLRAEMLRHFNPAEVVELTAGLALFMGFSKIAVALGQEPAAMPTTLVPTPDLPESDER
jgi:AhpD family alkylhydroperoxidase